MASAKGRETELINNTKKQRFVLRITFSKLCNKILEIFQTEDHKIDYLIADFNLLKAKNDKLKSSIEEIII